MWQNVGNSNQNVAMIMIDLWRQHHTHVQCTSHTLCSLQQKQIDRVKKLRYQITCSRMLLKCRICMTFSCRIICISPVMSPFKILRTLSYACILRSFTWSKYSLAHLSFVLFSVAYYACVCVCHCLCVGLCLCIGMWFWILECNSITAPVFD